MARVPVEIRQPFNDLLSGLESILDVLHLSMRGIAGLRGVPELLRALEVLERESDDGNPSAEVLAAERMESLAQVEVETGFPLLHAQALTSMCSTIEDCFRNFVAAWLSHAEGARDIDAVRNLKIRLGDFISAPEQDRWLYVAELLELELRSSLKEGASRFDVVLDVFGLRSHIDDDTRRGLYEMYQVRHVLVHRRGLVDRKLLSACPWLEFEVSTRLKIDHQQFMMYNAATLNYFTSLINRTRQYYDEQPDPNASPILYEA